MTELRNGCCGKEPCENYSFKLRKCKLGYVNPKSISGGFEGAKMGLLKPCPLTKNGQKVRKLLLLEQIEKLSEEEREILKTWRETL